MVKQLHTNLSLLIAIDLRQLHYQVLSITYLALTKKNEKEGMERKKKSDQNAILSSLKIID